MGFEIEYKYKVASADWREDIRRAVQMRQGYFETADDSTVRVRLVEPVDPEGGADPAGELTIKGLPTGGVRPEFEYTIPPEDVERMLELFCGDRQVRKVRHYVDHAGHEWVVDVFEGRHEGLVLAEIELDAPDEAYAEPDWVGEDVTGDRSFTNAALARR
jgi:adenylate cyclase